MGIAAAIHKFLSIFVSILSSSVAQNVIRATKHNKNLLTPELHSNDDLFTVPTLYSYFNCSPIMFFY